MKFTMMKRLDNDGKITIDERVEVLNVESEFLGKFVDTFKGIMSNSLDPDIKVDNTDEYLEKMKNGHLGDVKKMFMVSYIEDKVLKGIAVILPLKETEIYRIVSLGVKEEFRNKGIGKSLLEGIILEAKKRGLRKIYLNVHINNKFAIQLYKKVGFEVLLDQYNSPYNYPKKLENMSAIKLGGGRSNNRVFLIKDELSKSKFIAKYSFNDENIKQYSYERKLLRNEYKALEYLDEINGESTIFSFSESDQFILLIRKFYEGKAINSSNIDLEKMVKLCANKLRRIHSIEVDKSRFMNLNDKMEIVDFKVENGLVDEDDFEEENLGKSIYKMYDDLKSTMNEIEYTCLSHGDFTFKNIIYNEDNSNDEIDIIDWSNASISDPYEDISIFIRSIKHKYSENIADKLINEFIKEYGLETLDENKVNAFILLDEFL